MRQFGGEGGRGDRDWGEAAAPVRSKASVDGGSGALAQVRERSYHPFPPFPFTISRRVPPLCHSPTSPRPSARRSRRALSALPPHRPALALPDVPVPLLPLLRPRALCPPLSSLACIYLRRFYLPRHSRRRRRLCLAHLGGGVRMPRRRFGAPCGRVLPARAPSHPADCARCRGYLPDASRHHAATGATATATATPVRDLRAAHHGAGGACGRGGWPAPGGLLRVL